MAGPRIIPKGSKFWGSAGPQKLSSVFEIQRAYESGWCGAYREPEEHEALLAENKALTGFSSIGDAASVNGWAESGAGKLSIPFVHVMIAYPNCWPGPAQDRGDCVSHAAKNTALGSMVAEVVGGAPDEETGLAEQCPEVSTQGILEGVLSTEAIYWWRRHGGDGWYCSAAARVMQKESGLWLRQEYPELGIDLTKYSGALAGKYGANPPTGKIADAGKLHLARAFAEAKSYEERRDAIANGYFGFTCGSESWSNKRDASGFSPRTRAGWAHAMAVIATDDRASTIKKFGDSRELILNSWREWNTGPRDIDDSAQFVPPAMKELWIKLDIVNRETGNIMIPKGSFWANRRDCSQREWLAVSSVNGWPRKKLDNWVTSLAG